MNESFSHERSPRAAGNAGLAPRGSRRPPAAALLIGLAGGALLAGGAAAMAIAVAAAVAAVWACGSSDSRSSWGAWSGALFALSLGAGTLLAASPSATGPAGLPLALWGLLLGVFGVPLVLTGAGFALSFRPPDPKALRRLRNRNSARNPRR